MKRFIITAAFICLIISVNLFSQISWTHLEGPYGGWINFIHEDETGRLYAGSSALFYSDDKGENWQRLPLPDNQWTYALHNIFTSGDLILINGELVNDDQGFFITLISTDRGLSWSNNSWDNAADIPFFSFSYKKSPEKYLIGSNYLYEYDVASGKFSRLSDSTKSNYNANINSMVINEEGHYILSSNGIYKSADGGVTIDSVALGGLDTRSLCKTANGSILVAAFSYGIFRSTDGGGSWDSTQISQKEINRIVLTPDGTLLAATYYDGVYRSTNDGVSWSYYSFNFEKASDMLVDEGGDIYLSDYSRGIFKSTDNGLTWLDKNYGIDNNYIYSIQISKSGKIFTGCSGRYIFSSSDGGANWVKTLSDTHKYTYSIPAIVINRKGYLFAIGYNYISRSTNDGANWDSVYGCNYDEYPIFNIDKNDNIYLVSDYPVIKSTDDGKTWNKIYSKTDIDNASFFIDNQGNLFSGLHYRKTDDSTLIRSTDGGSSWQYFTSPAGRAGFHLACDEPGNLYMTCYKGIFLSRDKGENWTLINEIRNNVPPFFKYFNKKLFMIYSGGMKISRDGGYSWDSVSYNLPVKELRQFAMDSSGHFYLATDKGIFRSNDVLPVHDNSSETENLPKIYQTAINTLLTIAPRSAGPCQISVYDFLGNKCENVFNGLLEEKREFTINTENFANGIYFVRIVTDTYNKSLKFIIDK